MNDVVERNVGGVRPRRVWIQGIGSCAVAVAAVVGAVAGAAAAGADRPNILIAISDDQSYPHASAYGYPAVSTPAFDRVARLGVLCRNAFTPCPGCSPMRAAFLTGRNIWQLQQAGTHASSFPKRYTVFPDALERAGYFVGFTGKGWAPGNWRVSGRPRNPAGREFAGRTVKTPHGIAANDYAANFADFLDACPEGQPFCFWYGGHEPHRPFPRGIGRREGGDRSKVIVPPFLPDVPEVRDDLLDYCYEIEWFDRHLQRMLDRLEASGRLEHTLVIVTSDNGMSFPRAKANLYEYGIHMPLAVAWPSTIPGGRTIDDLINLIDVTATIYQAARVTPPGDTPLMGRGLWDVLTSERSGIVDRSREAVFCGRERHSSSRFRSLGYPQRAIRTREYLYIRNFHPERWPAGAPRKYGAGLYGKAGDVVAKRLGPPHGGYHDIDRCPTLAAMVQYRSDPRYGPFLHLAVDRRPERELYAVQTDPGCLHNLAGDPQRRAVVQNLDDRLIGYLRSTGDPRVTDGDGGDVWETYPRYSPLRWFPTPDWAVAHPEWIPDQPWLDARRPAGAR